MANAKPSNGSGPHVKRQPGLSLVHELTVSDAHGELRHVRVPMKVFASANVLGALRSLVKPPQQRD